MPVHCQEWNGGGWRNGVIDKSTLWNGVMYYIGEEYYLAIVETPKEDFSIKKVNSVTTRLQLFTICIYLKKVNYLQVSNKYIVNIR